ncbi:MAG: mannose-1-phosphate guanylyltransferase [Rhodospirillales bacterium 20-64-7]|nr:MAG: mannose-1-phosphate guanylyltransferase [Rhodospirillales bacterium 20-64-7]
MRPDTAVILSAGLGTRMRPLTLTTPKPLLHLAGRPILAHALERLRATGVRKIVVNAHYLADQIGAFLADQPDVVLNREPQLLDTGGAIMAMQAKHLLPDEPFYVVNGDAFWVDGPTDTLARLADAFDAKQLDAMLLLARTAGAMAETGLGDFLWPRGGQLKRREERDVAPYLYAGIQIVSPTLFAEAPPAPFSMNLLWDRALADGRLGAIVHDGVWFHLSTPEDLAHADAVLEAREVGNTT